MGVENVVCRSIVFPWRSFQKLSVTKAPSIKFNPWQGRNENAHVVRPTGLKQKSVIVRWQFVHLHQGDVCIFEYFWLGSNYPIVDSGNMIIVDYTYLILKSWKIYNLLEHRGTRIVNRHATIQVFFAVLLSDFFHGVKFGHPMVKDARRISIKIDDKVAGVIFEFGTSLVVHFARRVKNQRAMWSQGSWTGRIRKSQRSCNNQNHR